MTELLSADAGPVSTSAPCVSLDVAARIQHPSDLGPDRPLVFSFTGNLDLTVPARYGFDLFWLREPAPGALSGPLGLAIDAQAEASLTVRINGEFLGVVALDPEGWLKLKITEQSQFGDGLTARVAVGARPRLPGRPDELLAAILGPYSGPPPPAILRLIAAIREKALSALRNKYSAELSYHCQRRAAGAALLDCSFNFTGEGLRAYRATLSGDLSPALHAAAGDVRIHAGVFTHTLRRDTRLELRLPFMDRKQWATRLEALARARVETTEDGRLHVYTVEATDQIQRQNLSSSAMTLCGAFALGPPAAARFSLSYTNVTKLSPAQARSVLAPLLRAYCFSAGVNHWLDAALPGAAELEAALTLTVPGEMLAAWRGAPDEHDPRFGYIYTDVSVAVQRAMRRWLPYVYFSDLTRYDTLANALPLVVYQCTLPFRTKARNRFAYDIMSAESVAVARRSTAWALSAELNRIERLLITAGHAAARSYRSARKAAILASIERQPRLFHALLLADALYVDNLMRLGVMAAGLRHKMERDPQGAVRELTRFAAEFVTTFHRRLRRLYGGQNFVPFGCLLLVEATAALNAALKNGGAVLAILRLSVNPGPRTQTFVNAAYRPT